MSFSRENVISQTFAKLHCWLLWNSICLSIFIVHTHTNTHALWILSSTYISIFLANTLYNRFESRTMKEVNLCRAATVYKFIRLWFYLPTTWTGSRSLTNCSISFLFERGWVVTAVPAWVAISCLRFCWSARCPPPSDRTQTATMPLTSVVRYD